MDGDPVDKWTWLAANPKGFKRTRRRAALKLAETATPLAAMGLARAAANSGDEEVAALALRTFAGATDQEVIDAICGVWRNHRDSVLNGLILDEGWLASGPLELRMLTALHSERLDVLADGDAELAHLLLIAAEREAPPLNERARRALAGLTGLGARDAVCEKAIQDADPIAVETAAANDFAGDPQMRAVLLFLAGAFERLTELDFDGRLLARVHASADPSLRARLAAQARASSRVEWVRAIAGSRNTERLETLSDEEWASTLDVLTAAGDRTELWRLVFRAPPVWGARILRDLVGDEEREERGIPGAADELDALAAECQWSDPGDASTQLSFNRLDRSVDSDIVLSADGGFLGAANDDGSVDLWRLPSGERVVTPRAHLGSVMALAATPDGASLVSAGLEGFVHHWSLPSGTLAGSNGTGHHPIFSVAISADGSLLACGDMNGGVTLDRLPPGGERVGVGEFTAESAVDQVEFSRNGRILAARNTPGTVVFWQLTPGVLAKSYKRLRGTAITMTTYPLNSARTMTVAPDGAFLAIGGYDGSVRLWHLPSAAPARDLVRHEGVVSALAYSPDGRTVVSGDSEGWIGLSSTHSGSRNRKIHAHSGDVSALAVSSDGRLLASGGEDGRVVVRHLPSGRKIGVVSRHHGKVNALAMTPDGRVVASGGKDATIRVAFAAVPDIAYRPLVRITLAEVEQLRAEHQGAAGVLAWYDLIIALLAHRHRHDIGIGDADPGPAGDTDIELDEQQ